MTQKDIKNAEPEKILVAMKSADTTLRSRFSLSPANRYFLRRWLITVVAFVIGHMVFGLVDGDDLLGSIMSGVVIGALTGVFIHALELDILRSNLRLLGIHELTDEVLRPAQERIIATSLDMRQIDHLIQQSGALSRLDVNELTDDRLTYHQRYGYWKGHMTFGQVITIERLSSGELRIASRPRYRLLGDRVGINLSNVMLIRHMVTKGVSDVYVPLPS